MTGSFAWPNGSCGLAANAVLLPRIPPRLNGSALGQRADQPGGLCGANQVAGMDVGFNLPITVIGSLIPDAPHGPIKGVLMTSDGGSSSYPSTDRSPTLWGGGFFGYGENRRAWRDEPGTATTSGLIDTTHDTK
jgi:hypothetical protein